MYTTSFRLHQALKVQGKGYRRHRRGGDIAQLVERRTGGFHFPVRQEIIFPKSSFSALSYGVRADPYAITHTNICARVKDPIVYVRVRWIMETLKHPACTVGWVPRLCRSWFSTGKADRISHRRNSNGKYD